MSWLSRLLHRESDPRPAPESAAGDSSPGHEVPDEAREIAEAEPDSATVREDRRIYRVLVHREAQGRFYGGQGLYSLRALDDPLPEGWTDTGFSGSLEECSEETSRLGIAPIGINARYELRRWRGAAVDLRFGGAGQLEWLEILDVLDAFPRLLTDAGGADPRASVAERVCGALRDRKWSPLELHDGDGRPPVTPRNIVHKDWTAFAVAWNSQDFRSESDIERLGRLDELGGYRVTSLVILAASRELQAGMETKGADPLLIPDLTAADLEPALDAAVFPLRPFMLFAAKPAAIDIPRSS